jgi:hypothetical protein
VQQYSFDWVRWFNSGWRDGPSGNQVRGTFCYFIDINLTRPPLLSGLILLTPSNALGGLPVFWPGSLVGIEFTALLMVAMLLVAVGTSYVGLAIGGGFGWDNGNWHAR